MPFDAEVRPWAICTECGEPHPCGTVCPTCSGEVRDEERYRPIVAERPGRRQRIAGVLAFGLVGLGLAAGCLLVLGYFVAA